MAITRTRGRLRARVRFLSNHVRMTENASAEHPLEKLCTVKEAAAQIGLPYFKLARAVRDGLIPSYTLYNSRRLVRISEILTVIEASRKGSI